MNPTPVQIEESKKERLAYVNLIDTLRSSNKFTLNDTMFARERIHEFKVRIDEIDKRIEKLHNQQQIEERKHGKRKVNNIELNTDFSFLLETTKQTAFVKRMGEELDSSQTRSVLYGGGGTTIKKGKCISLVFLSKKENGYIVYLSNYTYGVGHFLFISFSEAQKLLDLFVFSISDEEVDFCNWRLMCYKDSIISDFVDPVKQANDDYLNALNEATKAVAKADVKIDEVMQAKENLNEMLAKFNQTQKKYEHKK